MIVICHSEFNWLDMTVNADKSSCIRVGKRYDVEVSNVHIDSKAIKWSSELKYLGIVFVASKTIKYNLHRVKQKYFKCLNGLLGKMGSSPNIQLTLSLINTFCTPVLCYGLEAMRLNKTQLNSLSFSYNSGFMKLFSFYNTKIIMQCQYFSGY